MLHALKRKRIESNLNFQPIFFLRVVHFRPNEKNIPFSFVKLIVCVRGGGVGEEIKLHLNVDVFFTYSLREETHKKVFFVSDRTIMVCVPPLDLICR